jgi:hypothetical protein
MFEVSESELKAVNNEPQSLAGEALPSLSLLCIPASLEPRPRQPPELEGMSLHACLVLSQAAPGPGW